MPETIFRARGLTKVYVSGEVEVRALAGLDLDISNGGAVALPGIGKVVCRTRPERQVRNPATGETMTKPADKVVKISIAKALKDSVNG